jgi:hypothetical protein
MIELAKRMLPDLEKCTAFGTYVEKCPYDIPMPQRVKDLVKMFESVK